MATNRIQGLVDAESGETAVLQGNVAFAVGCARGGIHAADGYPGTPSTEVIDKGLKWTRDRMQVGWSVNEASAVAVGFGMTMAGADVVVTMKIPGLFQAADAVTTIAFFTGARGGLVLYVASDFLPSSTQHVIDPRYFLKSAFIPILEPRDHQEMIEAGPVAAQIARAHRTPVVVLANGLLCHSEGLVRLPPKKDRARLETIEDFSRFMNLPVIARNNYNRIMAERMPALQLLSDRSPLNRIEWHGRSLGIVTRGITECYINEVWRTLPVKPSMLSLGMTHPVPKEKIAAFADGLTGPIIVLEDGRRFIQEELTLLGLEASGKEALDPNTEWTPDLVVERISGTYATSPPSEPERALLQVNRPPTICAGCPYRAFGLVVSQFKKKKRIIASFGDIGCNTLLYFSGAIDTCVCMGASDAQRQGVVLMRPELAGKTISVIGDSTECHSGLDSTRNAVFKNIPGVKVVLDNAMSAMTGGQPAPSSSTNLEGDPVHFDLATALRGEGARVIEVDAYDLDGIRSALSLALHQAGAGVLSVLLLRGTCMIARTAREKEPLWEVDEQACTRCDACLVCPGIEAGPEGYPRFTHLCNGCGGATALCKSRCHHGAIIPLLGRPEAPPVRQEAQPELETDLESRQNPPSKGESRPGHELRTPAPLPREESRGPASDSASRRSAPGRAGDLPNIRVSVRGVGGQGNLFVGKVLAEVARLAGYQRLLKGETHGMAQHGGPVLSTFGCGDVYSPVPARGSVQVLMALEAAEVLRPGFLEQLEPGGSILLNRLMIVPAANDAYPSLETIRELLGSRHVIEFDALEAARSIGDLQGKTCNVIALGLLSTVDPLEIFSLDMWQEALARVSFNTKILQVNTAAFMKGRSLAISR